MGCSPRVAKSRTRLSDFTSLHLKTDSISEGKHSRIFLHYKGTGESSCDGTRECFEVEREATLWIPSKNLGGARTNVLSVNICDVHLSSF